MRHRKVFSMSIGGLAAASIVCMALLGSVAPSSQAAEVYWNGGAGNWTDDNWVDGNGDSSDPSQSANDHEDSTWITGDGDEVTLSSADKTSGELQVGAAAGTPTLNITDGSLDIQDPYWPDLELGNVEGLTDTDTAAEFNMTGGSLDVRNFSSEPAVADQKNPVTTISFNFGSADATGQPVINANGYNFGKDGGTHATGILSGHGQISTDYELQLGDSNPSGTELLEVRGGNLDLSFDEGGYDAVEFGNSSTGGNPDAYTIRYVLDGTGVSTMNFGGDVAFGKDGGANETVFDLELTGGYDHVVGKEFTILSAAGSFTNHGQFKNVSDGDTLTVDGNEFTADYGSGSFSITAVPEPSSLLLLGLAGLLLMRRRRL